MSGSSEGRLVPLWMAIACWLLSLPLLIDGEYWLWMKVPLFLPIVVMTIGVVRQRSVAA